MPRQTKATHREMQQRMRAQENPTCSCGGATALLAITGRTWLMCHACSKVSRDGETWKREEIA